MAHTIMQCKVCNNLLLSLETLDYVMTGIIKNMPDLYHKVIINDSWTAWLVESIQFYFLHPDSVNYCYYYTIKKLCCEKDDI